MLKWLTKKFEEKKASLQARLERSAVVGPDMSEDPLGWRKRGNFALEKGDLSEAAHCYKNALNLTPTAASAWVNLGFVKFEQKMYTESKGLITRALELDVENMDAWYILGGISEKLNDLSAVDAAYRKAIQLKPDFEAAYLDLFRILFQQGLFDLARQLMEDGIKQQPNNVNYRIRLGNIDMQLGRNQDALNSYRFADVLAPLQPDIHLNMGTAMLGLGDFNGAIEYCKSAVNLKSSDAIAYNTLGIALVNQGHNKEAIAAFTQALLEKPDFAGPICNIGSVFLAQGRLDDAIDYYRQALELDPHHTSAQSNLLFALNYHPDLDASEIYNAYRCFDKTVGMRLRKSDQDWSNSISTNRRIRIGYVSPDLRRHTVMRFLEPVLAQHDIEKFEIFAYSEVSNEDEITLRVKNMVSYWRCTVGLSDDAVALMIREDLIDVLVDVAGHTGGNRLNVFARKPAPVSLSWMGYGYTTGLSAIDYYLTDRIAAPEESEHLFAEKPWRLQSTAYVYRSESAMGAFGPSPASTEGYVTFCTLTRPIRINYRVVRVWAEILKRVPDSRLVVDSKSYAEYCTKEALIGQFVALGIARERLAVGYHSPPWDLMRSVDITLDCFPHNSGTTLFESLYMGVPFVTLAGRPSVGRLGAAILEGLGRSEWVADSEEEYIEIAVRIAQDIGALAEIRLNLRSHLEASCLMDEKGFTQNIEQAYREMFEIWAANPIRLT